MQEKVQPTQEFKEVNKQKKKHQLKKVRKMENLGLLARKMVIIQELLIVIGALLRQHTQISLMQQLART